MKLQNIKVNDHYVFVIEYNYGAGSGSQGRYSLSGRVKEINPEFIRVIPDKNILEGNRRSEKVYNHSISNVF